MVFNERLITTFLLSFSDISILFVVFYHTSFIPRVIMLIYYKKGIEKAQMIETVFIYL